MHHTPPSFRSRTTYKQEGAYTEYSHDPDHLRQDGGEDAQLVGAEEVVPSEDQEAVDGAGPGVDQEQQKVLQVPGADAVVHPRAVVVHPADAAVADAAVVRVRRLEALALGAHAELAVQQPLRLRRHRGRRHAAGVRQRRLHVAGQRQRGKYAVRYGQGRRYPIRLRQERHRDCRV